MLLFIRKNTASAVSLSLLAALLIATEVGYQVGLSFVDSEGLTAKTRQIIEVQSSMFGIVALTLGFTLAASLERYRTRLTAVVNEANAIGTAYLRSQLIPASVRVQAKDSIRDYLALRVRMANTELGDLDDSMIAEVNEKQSAMWDYAQQAATEKDSPTTSLYVAAINEVIDSFGRRKAALQRHMPLGVIALLLTTFVMTSAVSGFVSATEGHRPTLACYFLIGAIVLQIFVVTDLDRPRGGLIKVPQDSLLDLQASIEAEA